MAKTKLYILQIMLTLITYLGLAIIIDSYFFILYCIIIVCLDRFVFKNQKTFFLYITIPALAITLMVFDVESIYRGLIFIIALPILYFINTKKLINYKLLSLSFLFIIFSHFVVNPNWQQFYRNYLNNNDLTPNFEVGELVLKDDRNKTFNFDENQTYLLDFWYTSCSQCYAGMSKIKEWVDKNPDKKINIILVNTVLPDEKFEDNIKRVEKYNFKNIYTELSPKELKHYGITQYPTHLVIKKGKTIYKGLLSTDKFVISKNINYYVD